MTDEKDTDSWIRELNSQNSLLHNMQKEIAVGWSREMAQQ